MCVCFFPSETNRFAFVCYNEMACITLRAWQFLDYSVDCIIWFIQPVTFGWFFSIFSRIHFVRCSFIYTSNLANEIGLDRIKITNTFQKVNHFGRLIFRFIYHWNVIDIIKQTIAHQCQCGPCSMQTVDVVIIIFELCEAHLHRKAI